MLNQSPSLRAKRSNPALAPHASASSKAATVAPERGDNKTKHRARLDCFAYGNVSRFPGLAMTAEKSQHLFCGVT
jgi:hypothetical protein